MRLGAMTLPTLVSWIILLVPASFSTTAFAVTHTPIIGNESGTPFEASCAPGQALVGFGYFLTPSSVNSIVPVCSALQNNTPVGRPILLDEVGSKPGTNGRSDTSCPVDMAVFQMQVYLDTNSNLHHVRLECHVTNGDNKIGVLTKATEGPRSNLGTHGKAGCVDGNGFHNEYATGLIGTYANGINGLGLRCHSAEDDAANTDTNNTDQPPADQPGQRTAASATTIYAKPGGKEVDYLDEGDAVTIVSCEDEGQGWCQISAPKKGYVWGGDLNP